MKLKEYIDKNFSGSQVEFAKHIGKPRQRVTQMLNAGYIVVNSTVYSRRFDLPDKKLEKR